MHLLSSLIGHIVPKVFARNIETLGSGTPGIDQMWDMITSVFPHTDIGSDGLAFVLLKITDFILKTIGGLAVVMLIYGGIKMITGGEEGLGEGKKIIMYSLIGLIAAMVADAVVVYTQVIINAAAN
jgi:hypothetical protein